MSHPHLQARDDAGPTPADLAELGRGFWDLLGEAESLAGEADLNVKLRVGDQVVVLKATPPGTPREDVELQAAVLDHLVGAETGLHVPAVLPTRSGESLVTGKLPEGEYVLRVLSFVEGRLLADVRPRTDGLVRGLGAALGRLDRALEGFEQELVRLEGVPAVLSPNFAYGVHDQFPPAVAHAARARSTSASGDRFKATS